MSDSWPDGSIGAGKRGAISGGKALVSWGKKDFDFL
jgi:hypothetical protein